MVAKSEREAMIDIHMDQPSMWMFVNPNVHGPLGYPTGYEIMPGTTVWSLLDADDGVQKVGAFSNHQLWVTPYQLPISKPSVTGRPTESRSLMLALAL